MTSKEEYIAEANADPTVASNRVSILYGDYGKRKTTTACTMVSRRGLLLSSDDSWKVLLNNRHSELFSKITVKEFKNLSAIDYVDLEGYDTIIWDTVSRSVADYISIILKNTTWNGNMRETLSVNAASKAKYPELKNLENVGISDYRVTRDWFAPKFDKLFKTPSHLIFLSQATEPVPGLSKDQRTRPMIPAATFQIIAERADLIVNIKPGTRNFVADMTENSSSMLAKSRIQGLEGKMDLDAFTAKYKEIVFK